MNEFIVWDKKLEKFFEMSDFINKDVQNPILEIYRNTLEFPITKDICMFPYIGKTDINNKKIYADCSIVEFIWRNVTFVGFFVWNKISLSYDLTNIENSANLPYYDLAHETIGLKIIDTIQENKLGLIEKAES